MAKSRVIVTPTIVNMDKHLDFFISDQSPMWRPNLFCEQLFALMSLALAIEGYKAHPGKDVIKASVRFNNTNPDRIWMTPLSLNNNKRAHWGKSAKNLKKKKVVHNPFLWILSGLT